MAYDGPGKKKVEKAGSKVRRVYRNEPGYGLKELIEARSVLRDYRSQFSMPLVRVNNRLRGRIRTLGFDSNPTQRLKKLPTILDKLDREPTLSPWRMADIGGCRIIVDDLDELRKIQHSIETRWPGGVNESSDYVTEPRQSGYRAVHCYVKDIGTGLVIEVQIRTPLMQSWAEDVESVSGYLGINYKQDGDSAYHRYMQHLSQLHHAIETGGNIPEDLRATLRAQRAHVVRLMHDKRPGEQR